uniref:GRAM domain-containing protein n=1 Tax=Panagrellus redivivus TaxID=6233 RepID=A0A7E4W808_PANRE
MDALPKLRNYAIHTTTTLSWTSASYRIAYSKKQYLILSGRQFCFAQVSQGHPRVNTEMKLLRGCKD